MRRDRQIAVGGEAQIIGKGNFEPVGAAEADVGDEDTAARIIVGRVAEPRQRDEGQAEDFNARALVADLVLRLVVNDADGADLPARVLGAARVILDRAGRVGGVFQLDIAVVETPTLHRGEPRAIIEHDEHILDDAVAQRVGQHDAVAIGGVAFGILDRDIALGDHFACLAVPRHLVGAHRDGVAVHFDIAVGNDDVGVAVVIQIVGGKADLFFVTGLRCIDRDGRNVAILEVGLRGRSRRSGGRRGRAGLRRGGHGDKQHAACGGDPKGPRARRVGEQSPTHLISLSHTLSCVHPLRAGCFSFATRERNPYRSGTFQSIIA